MSFFDRLSSVIAEKNLTFRKVERDCGLANASIRRWETQSPRLESVVTVANYLGVSVEYLATGRCENTTGGSVSYDGEEASKWESDLIAMTRLLSKRDRETAFDIVTMLYEKATGKKGSIYSTYTADELRRTSEPGENGDGQSGIA